MSNQRTEGVLGENQSMRQVLSEAIGIGSIKVRK